MRPSSFPGFGPGTYRFRVFATVGKVPGDPTPPAVLTIHPAA